MVRLTNFAFTFVSVTSLCRHHIPSTQTHPTNSSITRSSTDGIMKNKRKKNVKVVRQTNWRIKKIICNMKTSVNNPYFVNNDGDGWILSIVGSTIHTCSLMFFLSYKISSFSNYFPVNNNWLCSLSEPLWKNVLVPPSEDLTRLVTYLHHPVKSSLKVTSSHSLQSVN